MSHSNHEHSPEGPGKGDRGVSNPPASTGIWPFLLLLLFAAGAVYIIISRQAPPVGLATGAGPDAILPAGLQSGGKGWIEFFSANGGSVNHDEWRRVKWAAYNDAVGVTRVAAGDLDGDGKDEYVVGLGPYPLSAARPQPKSPANFGFRNPDCRLPCKRSPISEMRNPKLAKNLGEGFQEIFAKNQAFAG